MPPRRGPPPPPLRPPGDVLPDVRDGLSRVERIVLHALSQLQRERGGANVPVSMLYGRVLEKVDLGVDELQRILGRLSGRAVD